MPNEVVKSTWDYIVEFVVNNWAEIFSVLIALVALVLSVIALRKEAKRDRLSIPKLEIDVKNAQYLKLTWYSSFRIVFAELDLTNARTSEIDISDVILVTADESYSIGDFAVFPDEGNLIYSSDDDDFNHEIPLFSGNILRDMRVNSWGHRSAYVCFFVKDSFAIVGSEKIVVKTPIESYEKSITITPFPESRNLQVGYIK